MLRGRLCRENIITTSFTPVNRNNTQPQYVKPSKILTSKALDSAAIYDLPDEALPEVAAKKQKTASTQGNKGRDVSLGIVWEYNDDEDPERDGDADGHISKKRRATPAKRSKSTKVQSKMLSQSWGNSENAQPDDRQNSQLTTPPDSNKRAKRPTASSTTQSRVRKTKPFKNPTITKPSVVREKPVEDSIPSLRPVSTYIGWRTTQDAVKLNSNGIAKTTLDKLAAFRYKPSANFSNSDPSHNLPVQRGDHSELEIGQLGLGRPSSDYSTIPSFPSLLNGRRFESPEPPLDVPHEDVEVRDSEMIHLRDAEMPLKPSSDDFYLDVLWTFESTSQVPPRNSQSIGDRELGQTEHAQPGLQLQQRSQANGIINFDESSHQSAPCRFQPPPPTLASLAKLVEYIDNSVDLSSSEANALVCLPDVAALEQGGQHTSESLGAAENSPKLDRSSVAYLFFEEAMDVTHADDYEAEAVEESLHSFRADRTDFDEQLQPDAPVPCSQLGGRVTEVQVERYDIDDAEEVSREVTKDSEPDEFTEGLDDSDFLDIVSDPAISETQFKLRPMQREKSGTLPQSQQMSFAPVPPQDAFTTGNAITLALKTNNNELAIQNLASPLPQILSSEPDDEYPMDEADEEVFKLQDLMTTGVVEKFQAPASLQYAFGDDPGSGEVYDSSLQFSPPKPQRTPASAKKLHTDIPSTATSPAHRSDIEALPVGGAEDWNFLRTDHPAEDAEVEVIFEAPSEPLRPMNMMNGAERREYMSSPSPKTLSHALNSGATPGASIETDLAFINWVLDDSHEYRPLQPFARPDFPILARDRSPVTGVSALTFLRVCFRIGELFKEGARCEALKQDAVIELFARVTFSSREAGTNKQHFQFADLWHDRPPFPNGVLFNYRTSGLVESESKALLGADEGTLARCLGRLKRDSKSETGWMLHIANIRMTDWEEIKWTKRIVSADLVKSERVGLLKLRV
ncbi:hypothetical protein NA56DRAFT_221817 [Hyaloscypha hepaticicola]|uniref:Uncharacterized protein n=1 Tax=Hyaloscypha hepaticicola TaxID=2082293 RepID=A0A2J6PXQ6_9HELO|nr:hypothetical protein NA56DRAFT_221817 [Hyaloscypha hepaticicola]